MGNLWVPGDSDFALALREPNLLVPHNKAIGSVEFSQRAKQIGAYSSATANTQLEFNYVGKAADWTFQGSYVSKKIADDGYGATNVISVDSYWSEFHRFATIPALNRFTILYRFKFNALLTNNILLSLVKGNNDRAHLKGYEPSGSGTIRWYNDFNSNATGLNSAAGISQAGVWTWCALTWDGTAWRVYYGNDFTEIITGTSANGLDTLNSNPVDLRFGWDTYGGYQVASEIDVSQIVIFEKALTPTSLKAIADSSLKLYVPANQTPFLVSVPAAGGAPTLSDISAESITSTSATPRITVTF